MPINWEVLRKLSEAGLSPDDIRKLNTTPTPTPDPAPERKLTTKEWENAYAPRKPTTTTTSPTVKNIPSFVGAIPRGGGTTSPLANAVEQLVGGNLYVNPELATTSRPDQWTTPDVDITDGGTVEVNPEPGPYTGEEIVKYFEEEIGGTGLTDPDTLAAADGLIGGAAEETLREMLINFQSTGNVPGHEDDILALLAQLARRYRGGSVYQQYVGG